MNVSQMTRRPIPGLRLGHFLPDGRKYLGLGREPHGVPDLPSRQQAVQDRSSSAGDRLHPHHPSPGPRGIVARDLGKGPLRLPNVGQDLGLDDELGIRVRRDIHGLRLDEGNRAADGAVPLDRVGRPEAWPSPRTLCKGRKKRCISQGRLFILGSLQEKGGKQWVSESDCAG